MLRPRSDKLTQDELINQLRLASLLPAASTMPCLPRKAQNFWARQVFCTTQPSRRREATARQALRVDLLAHTWQPRDSRFAGISLQTHFDHNRLVKTSLATWETFEYLDVCSIFLDGYII